MCSVMTMVRYAIIREGDHWAIDENGVVGGEYLTWERLSSSSRSSLPIPQSG